MPPCDPSGRGRPPDELHGLGAGRQGRHRLPRKRDALRAGRRDRPLQADCQGGDRLAMRVVQHQFQVDLGVAVPWSNRVTRRIARTLTAGRA